MGWLLLIMAVLVMPWMQQSQLVWDRKELLMPEWVLTHMQEYMFFDLIIQTVNMLLLVIIVMQIIKARKESNQQKGK